MTKLGKAGGRFDINGDGTADEQGWISARHGFLVVDRNNNGLIDNGAELSLMAENPAATSGFAALAVFDSNGDKVIDDSDARFSELKLWVDANSNGATDAGKLKSLKDAGIASIGLAENFINGVKKLGYNFLLGTGVFKRADGTQGTIGNTALAYRPGTKQVPAASVTPPAEAAPTPAANSSDPLPPESSAPQANPLDSAAPTEPLAPGDVVNPQEQAAAAVFSSAALTTLGAGNAASAASPGPAPIPLYSVAANLFGSAMASFGANGGTGEINGILDPPKPADLSLAPSGALTTGVNGMG